jgi:hypothetical protein
MPRSSGPNPAPSPPILVFVELVVVFFFVVEFVVVVVRPSS